MQISTIKFSQIKDRIDAEYYKPEFLGLEGVLENSQFLGDLLLKIDRDPNFYNIGYTKTGIPLIRGLEFQPPFLELSKVEHISAETHERFKKTEIYPKDLVMTVRGTIGKVAIVPEELKIANISPNLIFLRPKNLFQSVFLAVVLNSKIGQSQIERIISGSVQGTITVPDIESIKIPIPPQPFQQKIEKMVKESQEKRKLADEQYKEAEEILNKKLGLEDLNLSTQKTFEIKFSEAEDRLDPEYYQPKFREIEKIFNKLKIVSLGEISSEIKYGTSEDLFYVEKGIPFLRVTDINKFSDIELQEGKFINNFDAERLKEYQVKKDDIIISRTGTLGLAVYINEKLDGAIFGSYFIKVKPRHKDLSNKFIAYFISSKIGRLQTNRWASGGIQTNLTIDAIKSIQIPIFPRPTQQKISSLIQKSFQFHKEARELMEKAKKEVEKIILA